jgi:hypothetical protein
MDNGWGLASARTECGSDTSIPGTTYCSGDLLKQDTTHYDRGCRSNDCFEDVSTTTATVENCDDLDETNYGGLFCKSGDVYIRKQIVDGFCSGNSCDYTITDTDELRDTCNYGCSNNVCNGQPNQCDNPADSNNNCEITLMEVMTYAQPWIDGQGRTLMQVMQVGQIWIDGGYY